MAFLPGLRTALAGTAGAPLVLLGNFEVEHQWAAGETGLPTASFGATPALVSRLDELALLLAGAQDHVVLKAAPDPSFLDYLHGLGADRPGVICAGGPDPRRPVTEDALDDPAVLAALTALRGAHLLPHGVSEAEEALARATGLGLAAAGAAAAKSVNSKVYSRQVAAELGLRQPRGWACGHLDDLAGAAAGARELLARGRRVVVKDAYGVSGKGMSVVDDERRLARLLEMVGIQAVRRDGRLGLVVEEWVGKSADLCYHLTIGADATVHFDFVREALIADGAHQGNRIPARLPASTMDEMRDCAGAIGARLAKDGYHGVVGVDAMLDPAGGLYPVNEINARNTMSTYHAALADRTLAAGLVALARHYPLRLARPVPFDRLHRALDGVLARRIGEPGVVLQAFGTVSAGRLYAFLAAATPGELEALDADVGARLAVLTEESGDAT